MYRSDELDTVGQVSTGPGRAVLHLGWRRRRLGGKQDDGESADLNLLTSFWLLFIGLNVCVCQREGGFSLIPVARNLRPPHAHILWARLSLTRLRRSADMKWYFLITREKHNFLSLLFSFSLSFFYCAQASYRAFGCFAVLKCFFLFSYLGENIILCCLGTWMLTQWTFNTQTVVRDNCFELFLQELGVVRGRVAQNEVGTVGKNAQCLSVLLLYELFWLFLKGI